jgi:hypothetical protein
VPATGEFCFFLEEEEEEAGQGASGVRVFTISSSYEDDMVKTIHSSKRRTLGL